MSFPKAVSFKLRLRACSQSAPVWDATNQLHRAMQQGPTLAASPPDLCVTYKRRNLRPRRDQNLAPTVTPYVRGAE